MARQTHYLELYADETAAHIVERLNALPRGARALFILPPDSPPLRERLDLTLVLRAAGRHAIRIAIISDHPQVLYQAAALQVSTFDTIGAAEAKRWNGDGRVPSAAEWVAKAPNSNCRSDPNPLPFPPPAPRSEPPGDSSIEPWRPSLCSPFPSSPLLFSSPAPISPSCHASSYWSIP